MSLIEDYNDDIWTRGWRMFTTSKKELESMLVGTGTMQIIENNIVIRDYPFEPSRAYHEQLFKLSDINNISVTSRPISIQVQDELIFVSAENKSELLTFAHKNHIRLVGRSYVWSRILEPFLDTDYSTETDERLTLLLTQAGLSEERVFELRKEVKTQMLKYNFDTMLWEWVNLDVFDVLRAMRTNYDKEQFSDFYKRAMAIALMD